MNERMTKLMNSFHKPSVLHIVDLLLSYGLQKELPSRALL